jgi:hypothetical protein
MQLPNVLRQFSGSCKKPLAEQELRAAFVNCTRRKASACPSRAKWPTFTFEVSPAQPSTNRYAHAYFSGIRSALADQLTANDVDTIDRLLTDDAPEALLCRRDLTVRGSRTAWAARRP